MLKLILTLALFTSLKALQCDIQSHSKYSCVCSTDTNNCSEAISEIPSLNKNDVMIYETNQASDERMKPILMKDALNTSTSSGNPYIFKIDLNKKFQKILGFGASFTDSGFLNMNSLQGSGKQEILEAYFGKSGIEYSMGRIPIASNDDSLRVYSYNDTPDDIDLKTFSIDIDRSEETGYKLENIKTIVKLVKDSGKEINLFASPWSPPPWMTSTGKTIHNPKLKNDPAIKASYVQYLKKFFEEYEKEGIDFWGMTAQNEPDGNIGY